MNKERSRWEIILDILKVTREEGKVKKTRMMHKANLDWRNFKRYFDFLQADGFIAKCNLDPDRYELTEKGKNLLQRLKELAELIDVAPQISNQFQYPTKVYPADVQDPAVELNLRKTVGSSAEVICERNFKNLLQC